MLKKLFGLIAGSISEVCSRTRQQSRCFSSKVVAQRDLDKKSFLSPSLSLLQEFKAVAKEDTGRYSCLASNGVGSPKMCEGKRMTIGVCARVCFHTSSCPFPPLHTFQHERKSGMQWRGKAHWTHFSLPLKYEPTLSNVEFSSHFMHFGANYTF